MKNKSQDDEYKNIPRVDYSDEELKYRSKLIESANHASNQRKQSWVELDDMDYETWYWKGKKAVEAYIQPKKNKEDVRVVTGTTREKNNTLLATLLNYNLEADITAFDDQEIVDIEIGQSMEAMVRKSRTLETPDYEEKRALIYKELTGAGNVFVEEQYLEYSIPEKDLEGLDWKEGVDPKKIKWKEKLNKVYGCCNSKMIPGLNVFLGNMREYFMELQPFVIVREKISRLEAEAMYGDWERWKYVPKELVTETNADESIDYNDYQMIRTEVDFVEIIRYFNKWKNEYMIMVNGVMMLPVGFPLSALVGVCEYPISKGDCEPISINFAYSRGTGAKTRMDQALMDEFFKMMVIKTRKSYKPPMGNKTGFNVGADIFMPAKIFKNLDADKLKPIGDNNGVTPAEFNMVQFVKEIIDNKTVTPIMEGQSPAGGATARQIIEQKQQSMIRIGMAMLGVINLEKRMAWLRIYNILKNWTTPIDKTLEKTREGIKEKNVYRKIDMPDEEIENGQTGRKVIEFSEDKLPVTEQVEAEEEIIKHFTGQVVRKTYINPKTLSTLKYYWHVNIEPTEKNTGMLKAAKFEEMTQKLLGMFAPLGKMPNLDYLGDRMVILNDESPDRVWQQPQQQGQDPMAQMQQMMQQGGQPIPNQLGAQLSAGQGDTQPDLSLNTLVNQ